MTQAIKVTLSDSVNPYHKHYNVYKSFIVKKGEVFKATGIEITSDHQNITVIPSECFKNEIEYWTYCEDNKVLCHCPEKNETAVLSEVSSVHYRDFDEIYYNYHFFTVRPIDYLIYFLQKLGITVIIEPNHKEKE